MNGTGERQGLDPSLQSLDIVIPVCNMKDHVLGLLEQCYREILPLGGGLLLVDDGSQDGLVNDLTAWPHLPHFQPGGPCRLVQLPTNQGRFAARYIGAQHSQRPWLLFLDARIGIDVRLVQGLQPWLQSCSSHAVVGWVEIPVQRSMYHAYWQALHERLYPAHFQHKQPFALHSANYDTFLKGTGVLLVQRTLWLALCADFKGDVRSDDTWLLRQLMERGPLWVDPRMVITWHPRAQWWPFLLRWWQRGPGFVAYHMVHQSTVLGRFARGVVVLMLGVLAFAVYRPAVLYWVLWLWVALLLGTSVWLAGSWRQGLLWLPLHAGTTLSFGCGVAWAWLCHGVQAGWSRCYPSRSGNEKS